MARETALRFDDSQDLREETLNGDPAADQETGGLLGQKVGTIRIHKLVGEGGMGAVYAGFDERLRREVALKAVRVDVLTSNGRSRLVVGTAGCMSPEQARGEEVSVASDMYSFGLLLQELFTGKPPYPPGLDALDLLREVQKGRTLPVTGIDAHLTDLIESLKSLASENRPSASEALQQLRWIGWKPWPSSIRTSTGWRTRSSSTAAPWPSGRGSWGLTTRARRSS
jgi:serine/threonine protein kinase